MDMNFVFCSSILTVIALVGMVFVLILLFFQHRTEMEEYKLKELELKIQLEKIINERSDRNDT